eukprot:Trichotokara_eunicae@DN8698_c0_g1_i1.p1
MASLVWSFVTTVLLPFILVKRKENCGKSHIKLLFNKIPKRRPHKAKCFTTLEGFLRDGLPHITGRLVRVQHGREWFFGRVFWVGVCWRLVVKGAWLTTVSGPDEGPFFFPSAVTGVEQTDNDLSRCTHSFHFINQGDRVTVG